MITNPFDRDLGGGIATLGPPEDDESLLRKIGGGIASVGLSGLSAVGNLLGLPGSMVKDVIAGQNPFDQLLHPFSHTERGLSVGGRELNTRLGLSAPNQATGIKGWLSDPMEAVRDIGGFATDVVTDPLFWLPAGTVAKGAKGAKAAATGIADSAPIRALAATRAGQAARRPIDWTIDHALAAFSKPVMGALGPEGRALGRNVNTAIEDAATAARGETVGMVEGFGKHLQGLDEAGRLREHDMLRDALEGVNPLPADRAHLQPIVDEYKTLRDRALVEREAEGVPGSMLQDPSGIEYATRRRTYLPGDEPTRGGGRGSRLLSGRTPDQMGREEFLKDLWEGTGIINRLSKDARFSGIAHAMLPKDMTPAFWQAQRQAVDAALQAGGHNYSYEHINQLTRWLADLNPEHVKQQIGAFAGNPIEEFANYFSRHNEAIGMARTMRETMAKNLHTLDDAPVGAVKATEAFTKAGLDPQKSLELLRQQAGNPDALYIPKELADTVGRVSEAFQKPSQVVEGIKGVISEYMKLWKSAVTSRVSFQPRNRVSGAIMNWMDGTFSARSEANISKLLKGEAMGDLPYEKMGPTYRGLSNEEATRMFAREAYRYNVAPRGQGITAEGLPEATLGKNLAADIPGAQPIDLIQDVLRPGGNWNPIDAENFKLYKASRNAGEWVEGKNRLSPYLELRLRGVAPEEAAAKVRAAQVDYSDLTNFERQYVRPLFPFYGFMKGMAKKVASDLIDQPGGRLAQTIHAQHIAGATGLPLPGYVGQTGAIPYSSQDDGTKSYITSLGLMHEDPVQFAVGGPMELASRMNPLIKAPIEMLFGKTLFQRSSLGGGRDIDEADPTLGRLLTNIGLQSPDAAGRAKPFIGQGFEHLLANSPIGGLLTRARTITDQRKGIDEKLVNILTGARITSVSPEAQDVAVRQAADTLAKQNLGARQYTSSNVSRELKEDIRANEPEKVGPLDAYDTLLRNLGRRNRARQQQEEATKRMLYQAVAP